jgi:hypothetical protein
VRAFVLLAAGFAMLPAWSGCDRPRHRLAVTRCIEDGRAGASAWARGPELHASDGRWS